MVSSSYAFPTGNFVFLTVGVILKKIQMRNAKILFYCKKQVTSNKRIEAGEFSQLWNDVVGCFPKDDLIGDGKDRLALTNFNIFKITS